jgi:hypothetical protein
MTDEQGRGFSGGGGGGRLGKFRKRETERARGTRPGTQTPSEMEITVVEDAWSVRDSTWVLHCVRACGEGRELGGAGRRLLDKHNGASPDAQRSRRRLAPSPLERACVCMC